MHDAQLRRHRAQMTATTDIGGCQLRDARWDFRQQFVGEFRCVIRALQQVSATGAAAAQPADGDDLQTLNAGEQMGHRVGIAATVAVGAGQMQGDGLRGQQWLPVRRPMIQHVAAGFGDATPAPAEVGDAAAIQRDQGYGLCGQQITLLLRQIDRASMLGQSATALGIGGGADRRIELRKHCCGGCLRPCVQAAGYTAAEQLGIRIHTGM